MKSGSIVLLALAAGLALWWFYPDKSNPTSGQVKKGIETGARLGGAGDYISGGNWWLPGDMASGSSGSYGDAGGNTDFGSDMTSGSYQGGGDFGGGSWLANQWSAF